MLGVINVALLVVILVVIRVYRVLGGPVERDLD